MSFFTPQTETVQVDDDNSITLRKLTFGEFTKLLEDNVGNEQAQGMAVVKASIVEWAGPGFDGRTVTSENINALPVEIVLKVIPMATQLNSVSDKIEGKA